MRIAIKEWARTKLKSEFEYGTNDCRWILVEFLQLNALWDVPEEIKKLRGSYKTEKGAYRVDKNMPKPVEEYLGDCGYKEIDDVEVKGGDIVRIQDDLGFMVYLPVIHSQVALVGDNINKKITQANVYDLDREYIVFRR